MVPDPVPHRIRRHPSPGNLPPPILTRNRPEDIRINPRPAITTRAHEAPPAQLRVEGYWLIVRTNHQAAAAVLESGFLAASFSAAFGKWTPLKMRPSDGLAW